MFSVICPPSADSDHPKHGARSRAYAQYMEPGPCAMAFERPYMNSLIKCHNMPFANVETPNTFRRHACYYPMGAKCHLLTHLNCLTPPSLGRTGDPSDDAEPDPPDSDSDPDSDTASS